MKSFYNDTRNVGGRDSVVDIMLMHKWKLSNVTATVPTAPKRVCRSPVAKTKESQVDIQHAKLGKASIVGISHDDKIERKNAVAEAPSLAEIQSYYRRNHHDVHLSAKLHKKNMDMMYHRIKTYDSKTKIDGHASSKLLRLNRKGFRKPSDGFSLTNSVEKHVGLVGKKLNEKRGVTCLTKLAHRYSITSLNSNEVKSRDKSDKNLQECLLRLENYLRRQHLTITDLFETSNKAGNGKIPAYTLRDILNRIELEFTQTEISKIIRAVDSKEDGLVDPLDFETVLRKNRWGKIVNSSKEKCNKRSPSRTNERPFSANCVSTPMVNRKIRGNFTTRQFNTSTINEEKRKKKFKQELRERILDEVVKQRLFRDTDLELLFKKVRNTSNQASREMVDEAILAVKNELEKG